MQYYSKIEVKETPQLIKKTIEKSLGYDGSLSIAFLKTLNLTDNDIFDVDKYENGEFFLRYQKTRIETEKERSERVKKEIDYNKRYDVFHSKKNNLI